MERARRWRLYSPPIPIHLSNMFATGDTNIKRDTPCPIFAKNLGAVPSDLPEDCHIDAYVGMKSIEYLESLDTSNPFFLMGGILRTSPPLCPPLDALQICTIPMRCHPFDLQKTTLQKKPPEYGLYFKAETPQIPRV